MIFSLVIPCYNEGEGLPSLLQRINGISVECSDIEFILVDNGSSDATVGLVKNAPTVNSSIKAARVEVNQGYGYGILQGLKSATGEFVGWTHADMQTDPADVLRAFKIIEKSSDTNLFIKGKRYARPFGDRLFTLGMGFVESILFQCRLFDINAQPSIFPRTFYESWINPPYDFSLDLYAYVMAIRYGLKVIRFPVLFGNRQYGNSHWNINWKSKIELIKRIIHYSTKLRGTL
jgi:glycosyltransferase involved in cell wall biosynthesis